MSTSCEPGSGVSCDAHPFPYAELPAGRTIPAATASAISAQADCGAAEREAAVRMQGLQEGEARARAAFTEDLRLVREGSKAALAEFARERALYFQQVEGEVVRLALSIARKILRREAQIDPLLLAGMVRVVLEKIESGTKVVARVHPRQVSECRAYFAQRMEAQEVPEVVEDSSVPLDHCTLHTSLGITEVGAEAELAEVEKGLLDLLQRRPPSSL